MSTSVKKIVIAGGTGFIGQYLTKYFSMQGYQIYILARSTRHMSRYGEKYLKWDGKSAGEWTQAFEGATAVINMAGRTVDCRYTEKNKREIIDSRVDSTTVIGKAIQQCKQPPKVWINAGSATIYRDSRDKDMDEHTGQTGHDFSMDVCHTWEATFNSIPTPQTRKLFLRISIVLGSEGGALIPMLNLVRFGMGGKQGDGDQYISWLHIKDLAGMIDWMISNGQIEGIINCVSPKPMRNRDFMKTLRKVYGRYFGLDLPEWAIRLGAVMIQTSPELVLKSRKVVPGRLQEAGYRFQFPELEAALQDIIHEIKA